MSSHRKQVLPRFQVPGLRRPRARQAGFTLLELMTIVTIVLIMAAIVAPAAARTYAIFRAQELGIDALMMARRARRESMESGRAIVVRFVEDRVELRRGVTSLCRSTDWGGTIFSDPCEDVGDINGNSCIDFLSSDAYSSGSYHTAALVPVGGADYDVCYQPNGEALAAPGDGSVFTRLPPTAGNFAARINVERREGGTSVDPVRQLIIPFDSAPRTAR